MNGLNRLTPLRRNISESDLPDTRTGQDSDELISKHRWSQRLKGWLSLKKPSNRLSIANQYIPPHQRFPNDQASRAVPSINQSHISYPSFISCDQFLTVGPPVVPHNQPPPSFPSFLPPNQLFPSHPSVIPHRQVSPSISSLIPPAQPSPSRPSPILDKQLPSLPSDVPYSQLSPVVPPTRPSAFVPRRQLPPIPSVTRQNPPNYTPLVPNKGLSPSLPGPLHDSKIPKFSTVDTAREAANAAVSNMKKMLGPVQDSAAKINEAVDFAGYLTSALRSLRHFNCMVDTITTIHPYAQAAWTVLNFVSKMIINQIDRDINVCSLLKKMNEVYTFLIQQELRDLDSMKTIVATICKQTLECAYFIQKYAQDTKFRCRFLKNLLSDTHDRVIAYNLFFDELLQQFRDRAACDTLVVVHRIWDQLEISATDLDLNSMPYVTGAGLDTGKLCLEDTRREILDEITDWINRTDDDAPRIFWLHGSAGTGKSAIVHTIADRFKKLERLGSCYCFDRLEMVQQRDKRIFTTIARDLADRDKHFRGALAYLISRDASLKNTTDIVQQWKEMILRPVEEFSEAMVGPILIVIDALDQSGNANSRERLLHILAGKPGKGMDTESHITRLPPNIKILLTSRPMPDIVNALKGVEHVIRKSMDSIPHRSTEDDIRRFVAYELSDLAAMDIRRVSYALASASDGLFEWARLACAFVKNDNEGELAVEERFERVLIRKKDNLLDDIYTLTLETIFPERMALVSIGLRRFQSVMAQIIATAEPLPLGSLISMRKYFVQLKEVSVDVIVKRMGDLLSGTTNSSATIRPLHASFPEFLSDRSRSGKFYVDSSSIHVELAYASLRLMKDGLHFNMCKLPNSYLRNSEVPDLAERIRQNISPDLSYSCRFWMYHLQATRPSFPLLGEVRAFFNHERLLFWFEVLSLEMKISTCTPVLSSVIEWAKQSHREYQDIQEIHDEALDAQKFIRMFGGAISLSTPHLYVSALPFSPKDSRISMKFKHKFTNLLQINRGHNMTWPAIQGVLHGHKGSAHSAAFSPGGKRIVSGSFDRTIRLWDADTGEPLQPPFEGHKNWIRSVAFSADGKHIVSASDDKTIRIWDAETGEQLGLRLEGHQGSVRSAVFSADRKLIVSASSDKTIRLWDAGTGRQLQPPFDGHQDSVGSVAFSSDNKRIVSGSDDKTIRVWDAKTGKQLIPPLEGHKDSVLSVAFSPDGKRIASASSDRTIRVWDATTGAQLQLPFEGHQYAVLFVSFSVDGKRIVSASSDRTIRVWDTETGEQLRPPLEGHKSAVRSAAFSVDGKRIVSASDDNTIRLWDGVAGEEPRPPLEGHSDYIRSISFSPDGKQLVSGSDDKTIRLWDVATGEQLQPPIRGHRNTVRSVSFSPDGRCIVSGSDDKTIRLWDVETGKESRSLTSHQGSVHSVAFSPNGKLIVSASGDKTIRIWEAETGKQLLPPLEGHQSLVRCAMFSADGKRILSASDDNTIILWDAETGRQLQPPLKGHGGSVHSAAFSADGRRIVSGSDDKTIRLWNAADSLPEGDQVHSFSAGGECIAPPEKTWSWDAEVGDRLIKADQNFIFSVAFSPNGKVIVSGSANSTVQLWDAETRKPLRPPLVGHRGLVHSVAFSPNGTCVASASSDSTIRLWEVEVEEQLPWVSGQHLIRFSSSLQHALLEPSRLVDPESIQSRQLRDLVQVESSGWVSSGQSSSLLFWAPPMYHPRWYPSSMRMDFPPPNVELDLSNMAHGSLWALCYQT